MAVLIPTFTITLAYRVKIKYNQIGNILLSDLINRVTSICKKLYERGSVLNIWNICVLCDIRRPQKGEFFDKITKYFMVFVSRYIIVALGLSNGNYDMISINNTGRVYLALPNDSITHHTKALGNQTDNFPTDDFISCTTLHSQDIISPRTVIKLNRGIYSMISWHNVSAVLKLQNDPPNLRYAVLLNVLFAKPVSEQKRRNPPYIIA